MVGGKDGYVERDGPPRRSRPRPRAAQVVRLVARVIYDVTSRSTTRRRSGGRPDLLDRARAGDRRRRRREREQALLRRPHGDARRRAAPLHRRRRRGRDDRRRRARRTLRRRRCALGRGRHHRGGSRAHRPAGRGAHPLPDAQLRPVGRDARSRGLRRDRSRCGAQVLVDRGVRLAGVDYLSVGSPETHRILLGARIVALEGLDLRTVRPGRTSFSAGRSSSSAPTARLRASCFAARFFGTGDGARLQPPTRLMAPTDERSRACRRSRRCRRRKPWRAVPLRARRADRAPRRLAVPVVDVHDQHLGVLPERAGGRARRRRARRAGVGLARAPDRVPGAYRRTPPSAPGPTSWRSSLTGDLRSPTSRRAPWSASPRSRSVTARAPVAA